MKMSKVEWKKSSFCGSCSDCVEVSLGHDDTVIVKDSKSENQPLLFSTTEWEAFVKGVKAGEFDFSK